MNLIQALWTSFVVHCSGIIVNCPENTYFDSLSLSCTRCDATGQVVAINGGGCACDAGFRKTLDPQGRVGCVACAKNERVSSDGWSCIACESGNCSECSGNQVIQDRDFAGSRILGNNGTFISKCASCSDNFSPDILAHGCHYDALASVRGLLVFNNSKSMFYVSNPFYGARESELLRSKLPDVYSACEGFQSTESCQALANLCIYSGFITERSGRTQTDACSVYLYAMNRINSMGVPTPYPVLYTPSSDIVSSTTTGTVVLKTNRDVQLVIYGFDIDGKVVGRWVDFESFFPCTSRRPLSKKLILIGANARLSCRVPANDLLLGSKLYEVYLKRNDGTLIKVPVLNRAWLVGNSLVNNGTSSASWMFLSRFHLVDTLVGLKTTPLSAWVTYASSLSVVFKNAEVEGWVLAYLDISYQTVELVNRSALSTFEFDTTLSVVTEQDWTKTFSYIKISAGVLAAVTVLFAYLRLSTWQKRSGRVNIDLHTTGQFLLFLLDSAPLALSAVFMTVAVCWTLVYKTQSFIKWSLPGDSDMTILTTLLYVSTALKAVHVFHTNLSQAKADVFFIDWEKPKSNNQPVSIFRTLFVANEWMELQTTRRLNTFTQLMLMLGLMVGFSLENFTMPIPTTSIEMTASMRGTTKSNPMLRMGTVVLLYWCFAALQWMFVVFIRERFICDPIGNFVDLCSLSNISVFVMDHPRRAFYIHGRSVLGSADTNMRQLQHQLLSEEKNTCGTRGLEPNSDIQTFSMLVGSSLSTRLTALRTDQASVVMSVNTGSDQQTPGIHMLECILPDELNRSLEVYQRTNEFLVSFFSRLFPDCPFSVRCRSALEYLFDLELSTPGELTLLYEDRPGQSSFATLFPRGQEGSLALFELLVFLTIDSLSTNFILSSTLTLAVHRILGRIRYRICRTNLSRKALIDQRFLI